MNRFVWGLLIFLIIVIGIFYIARGVFRNVRPGGTTSAKIYSTPLPGYSPSPLPSVSPLIPQSGELPATGL